MEPNKARMQFNITEDIMFRSPLWALLILAIWGAISFVMVWTLLNVIKPSIDQRIEEKRVSVLINNEYKNAILTQTYVAGK